MFKKLSLTIKNHVKNMHSVIANSAQTTFNKYCKM